MKEQLVTPGQVPCFPLKGFPGGSLVKNLAASAEDKTQVRSQGREDPLEKDIATHSSILQSSRLENPHGQRSLVGNSPQDLRVGRN